MLICTLEGIGLPLSSFGAYSFHPKGSTVAENIAPKLGIPDCIWRERSVWRPVQATQGYVVTSRDLKLKTTRIMLRALSNGVPPPGAHGPWPPSIQSPDSQDLQNENVQVPYRENQALGQYCNVSHLKSWMWRQG